MPASESDFAALALVHLRPPSQNAAFIAQRGRERLRHKRYIWCGYTICQEHDMRAATASLPGGPVTKDYFAQGMQLYGEYPYFYTFDKQGSIYQMIAGDGNVASQYQYDPYGSQMKVAGSMTSDIGYTGLFEHQPSGLALATFRGYHRRLGDGRVGIRLASLRILAIA